MKRPTLIFIVALVALFGSLTITFSSLHERNEQLRGYVDASQDANLPFRVPRLGVNAELTLYLPDQLDHQLDLMAAAHMNWVRQAVRWDEVEPHKGEFDWTQWDAIIKAMDAHHTLQLIVVFVDTPEWARSKSAQSPTTVTTPPADPADFAAFASAFAARYGQSVDYYQVWDEPNLIASWGGNEPRPADYAAMLSAAYSAIHSVDASATVISAALAPTTETGPKNISDILYLQELYTLGAKAYMDAVGAKPYGFSLPPDDRTVNPDVLNFSRIVALREVMVSNGDGAKALWASNWGWNSLPDNWAGKPSIWGSVSEADRVGYTLDALSRAEREWPWLGGMILQQWQPQAAPDDPQWGFAVLDQQNAPTPLLYALDNLPAVSAAQNGLFQAANPYVHYSGVWKLGSLGADIGWVQDSQFDFNFSGSSVSMLLRQDNYTAYLYPTIDGQQANAPPHDPSGKAYIILTSGSLLPELNFVPVGSNLTNGNHDLHVVADRGWDHWTIAAFGVSSGDLAQPYNREIAVAVLTTLVAAVTAGIAGWQLSWKYGFGMLRNLLQRLGDAGNLVLGAASSVALMIGMLLTWGDAVPQIFRRDPVPLGLAIATAGLIKLQPGFILTIAAMILLFVIFYHRLDIGLALIVFWIPFFLFPVELYRFAIPISEMLTLLTTAAWLLRVLSDFGRQRRGKATSFTLTFSRPKLTLMDYAVLLWVILGIVSLLWSIYHPEALTDVRVMIIEPALFYLVFRTARLNRLAIIRIIDALWIAGLVVAMIGLWQFVHGQSIITAEAGAERMASVYGSPNNVGLFLGRCLPFLFAFLFVKVDSRRRILSFIALIPMGIAVILSQSVGAIFVGVPAAFVAVALLALGRRARLVLLGFVAIALIAFVIALQFPRFARVLDFSSGTNLYRIRVWQSAINIIHDRPITGLGMDQFLYYFRGRYIMPDAWQEPNLSHPHDILLDFWVRLGLGGVLLLIAFQVAFWKKTRSLVNLYRAKDPFFFAIIIGMIGCMVDLLAHGLIDNSVYVQDLVYVFVLLLALAATLPNRRAIDEPLI